MLLETLDIKKNDIIIYSQNIFDLEDNFKIIFKDDPNLKSRKINHGDVCRFVNEYVPKNLIVYRLLTNIRDFNIQFSKYGFFVSINGVSELIYFDPIFAVKELEEYVGKADYYNMRFRIQQVGLTTVSRSGAAANFAEIFRIDLQAFEAQHQNDKAFIDALFAVSRGFKKNDENIYRKERGRGIRSNTAPKIIKLTQDKLKTNSNTGSEAVNRTPKKTAAKFTVLKLTEHNIIEDNEFDHKQIMNINYKENKSIKKKMKTAADLREKKSEVQHHNNLSAKDIELKGAFGKFLQNRKEAAKTNKHQNISNEGGQLLDIFKSSTSLKELIEEREGKKIVLKLDKKKKGK